MVSVMKSVGMGPKLLCTWPRALLLYVLVNFGTLAIRIAYNVVSGPAPDALPPPPNGPQSSLLQDNPAVIWAVPSLLLYNVLIVPILLVGASRYLLRLIRGTTPAFSVVFSGFPQILAVQIASWLLFFAVFVGCVLFLIPGVVAWVGLSMALFALADDDTASGLDVLDRSWTLVWRRGRFWKVLGFQLMWVFISILAGLAVGFVVGMLVVMMGAGPMTLVVVLAVLGSLMDTVLGSMWWLSSLHLYEALAKPEGGAVPGLEMVSGAKVASSVGTEGYGELPEEK